MKSKIKLITFSLFFIVCNLYIQAQSVNLSHFHLTQNNKQVLLFWTIDSGPTCNGITVWRSTDSVTYEQIGNIGGVCGSSSSAIPYTFTDDNPALNQTNYYKIRLGYSQYSEVISLFLKYIEPGKIIIKPSPVNQNVTIEFNNTGKGDYSFMLFNTDGKIVLNKKESGEGAFIISTLEFKSGTYILILTDSEGNIIREKLVITH